MKTRDRVATTLAPLEAEAIIEQARRRQRRRHRMIGLELVAVAVAWLVVMSVASGGIRDPFAAQGGARSAGAYAAARPPLSGQARVTWRATLGGVLQAYGGGGITFSGKNWSEDLATTVPAKGGVQPGDALTNRIVDGQGYFTANVHGRWVWVHDPHPDLPGLIFTELPDPRTLLRRLAPAARYQRTGKRGPASAWDAARNRVLTAQQHADQIRREIDVTEVTLTYSGIGQPQHITAPRHTIPVSRLG